MGVDSLIVFSYLNENHTCSIGGKPTEIHILELHKKGHPYNLIRPIVRKRLPGGVGEPSLVAPGTPNGPKATRDQTFIDLGLIFDGF